MARGVTGTDEIGHDPSEGHDVVVPAGNNCKGGSTTGSVENVEDRSSSRVEARVVVVEKGKRDLVNTI